MRELEIQSLSALKRILEDQLEIISNFSSSEHSAVREKTAKILNLFKGKEIEKILLRMTKDESQEVRAAALESLMGRGLDEEIIEFSNDPSRLVRMTVSNLLLEMRETEKVRSAWRLLYNDPDPLVRGHIRELLRE